jgi:hypothetical protein
MTERERVNPDLEEVWHDVNVVEVVQVRQWVAWRVKARPNDEDQIAERLEEYCCGNGRQNPFPKVDYIERFDYEELETEAIEVIDVEGISEYQGNRRNL